MSKEVYARSSDINREIVPSPSNFVCNQEERKSAIQVLEKPFFCLSDEHPWVTYNRIVSSSWQIVLLWFLNLKWGIKIDFLKTRDPLKLSQLEKCRMDADVLVALFNLCESLHSMERPTAMNYKSALRFWLPIATEFKGRLDFKKTRTGNAKEVNLILRKLKGGDDNFSPSNPYCVETKPRTYEFIEACLDVLDSKNCQKFERDLWLGRSKKLQTKGYIKALEAQYRWLSGTPKDGFRGSLFVDGSRLLVTTGRGSQYLEILHPETHTQKGF
jgi:hypothetical protein